MSSAMIRGLALVEAVGQQPGTVSDLARRLELDKAIVSRLLAAAEANAWLVRRDGIVVLGPRAASLGRSSEARDFQLLAHELAHALAGVTGLDAMVSQFAAGRGHPLSAAPGLAPIVADSDPEPFPLFATAIGLTFAAQLDDADLDRLLAEPLTSYTERTVLDPVKVRDRIDEIRRGGLARDDGEYAAGVRCLASPWEHPLAAVPTSISVLGPVDRFEQVEGAARRALQAAARPGASLSSIVAAAASR